MKFLYSSSDTYHMPKPPKVNPPMFVLYLNFVSIMKKAQSSVERVFGTYGKVERSDMNENLSCVWVFFFFNK